MTHLVLDKNPQQNEIKNYSELLKSIEKNTFNSLTYTEPFSKAIFIKQIIPDLKTPIIFLDFDLLFSGYSFSGSISLPENFILFQLNKTNWKNSFKEIIMKLSQKKSLLIIDSLNNFFSIFESDSDSGRLTNSIIMILTSVAKMSKSSIVIFSMTRNEKDNSVLSISGRKIPEIQDMNHFHFYQNNSDFRIIHLQKNEGNSFHVPITSELF